MLTFAAARADDKPDPVADPAAIVTSGNARFTILTSGLVRLEWSPDGKFEDRASFAFINRRLPVPKFTSASRQGFLSINTDKIEIRYKPGSGRFDKSNLTVRAKTGPDDTTWEVAPPFDKGSNLHGTTRTLDGISGSCPLEQGLLSQDGWTFIDDSQRPLFDGGERPWAAPRNKKDAIDWYFFCYGHEYKAALAEFIKVAGRIPLPPRFAFGAWWSRYWDYSADELKQLVKEFREHDVPLDVLVIDMGWHLDGWTGYTWNPKYFPDPDGFLKWVHEQGLKVTLNLHPAEGVGKQEKQFTKMCEAMGVDPAKTDRIPFDCTNKRFVDAYFDLLHHPLENQGVDFWWMDWQQGLKTKIDGLDPLWWLNYLHWTDMERRASETGRRPMIFSRWGGLGNHRYQIGFSGDTFSNWPSLAFQPYFTATAGNVGYAYWSHDIGGHQPGKVDPELYVRWLQWGALSPILRTHTTKNPGAERRIWEFPKEYFEAGRKAYELRYELIPYIYTAARQCYDTGVPICRPLYYEWPNERESYKYDGEYMFGDQLLVAPVTEPAEPISGCAMVEVWLPPGKWTNWFTGRTYEGNKTVPLAVPLDEIPIFVKSGGIIVTQPKMARSDEKPADKLIINIFPGDSGETQIYEDDGRSDGYRNGNKAWLSISHSVNEGKRGVAIGSNDGSYPGMPKSRHIRVNFFDAPPAAHANSNISNLILQSAPAQIDAAIPVNARWGINDFDLGSVPTSEAALLNIDPLSTKDLTSHERLPPISGGRGYLKSYSQALSMHSPDKFPLDPDNLGAWDKELKKAAGFEELWLKLIQLVSNSDRNKAEQAKTLIRLMGLFYKLTVSNLDENGRTFTAECRLATTLNLPVTSNLNGKLKFLSNGRFLPEGEGEREFHGLSQDTPVALTMNIENKNSLETTLVRGEIQFIGDNLNLTIPMEKVILPSINAWWLAGPFDGPATGALKREYPPEGKVDFHAIYTGKDGEKIGWRQFKRQIRPGDDLTSEFFVDFDEVFGKRVNECVVYGFTYLESPGDMEAVLALGSDDGVAIWLNDRQVYRNDIGRPYSAKSDHAPIHLKRGINTLLVKISQGGGDGGFGVHVEDENGKPLTQVKAKLSY